MLDRSPGRELQPQQPVDLPPKDALLADQAVRLAERLGDRVVLAREPADQQVDVGDDREDGPLRARSWAS